MIHNLKSDFIITMALKHVKIINSNVHYVIFNNYPTQISIIQYQYNRSQRNQVVALRESAKWVDPMLEVSRF